MHHSQVFKIKTDHLLSMNNMHNPRNPSQPPRQLALTNLQLRTNLVKTVLSIQILFQRFVVLMESDCFLRCSAFFALFVGEVVDAAIRDDAARAASMSDTRMKYGGVKRH